MLAAERQFVDVLCDGSTRAAAGSRIRFHQLHAVTVQEKDEPISVFVPSEHNQTQTALESTSKLREHKSDGNVVVLGRDNELAVIYGVLDNLVKNHHGSILVLEGDPGMGKSHIIKHLQSILYDLTGPYFRFFVHGMALSLSLSLSLSSRVVSISDRWCWCCCCCMA